MVGTRAQRQWILIVLTVVVATIGTPSSATPTVYATPSWTRQFGTKMDDRVAAASSNSAAIFVVGTTQGRLGTTAAGDADAYVCKYSRSGSVLWTRQFGTTTSDEAHGVAVYGNAAYVAGTTYGTLPGQGGAPGGVDAFVRKYAGDGTVLWTRQFGTSAADLGTGVAVTRDGVFVSGATLGTFSGNAPSGGADVFIRRYNHDGSSGWTRQHGSAAGDLPWDIAATADGVYVAGETGAAMPTQSHAGGTDGFVTKYDVSGTWKWSRQVGTAGYDRAAGVGASGAGVYVGGSTSGLIGSQQYGRQDAFLRKFDPDGNVAWTRQTGTLDDDQIKDVTATGAGIYAGGWTLATTQGYSDAFVRRYDADGVSVWTEQVGTDGYDDADAVAASGAGVFLGGYTNSGFTTTNAGSYDAFVHRVVGYRPDALISSASSSGYVGDDIYNTTGSQQTQAATVARGGRRTFYMRAQNDGDATDALRLDGCASSAGFAVKYFSGTSGNDDITQEVAGGTFRLGVTPGSSKTVRMVVKVLDSAKMGQLKTCPLTVTSTAEPSRSDVARARVEAGS